MEHILAFGHKNPDTDSICSAIAYANLKNILGESTIPYRLGELSKETKFVLEKFNFTVPNLLKTVSPQVSDLTKIEKKVINQNDSLKTALDILTLEKFSSLPVIDDKNHLKGMIYISDIANISLNLEHEELSKVFIKSIMKNSGFYSFKTDDFLHDIKDLMKENEQTNFPIIDLKGEVYGTIRSKNLINFTRKKIALLDHNERAQSVNGIEDAKIVQVIDHHKFGNFETSEPLSIYAEAIGSTCSLVYNLYKKAGIIPEKNIAGILLSAILADTLLFKSPTCTPKDILAANELGVLAGIESLHDYGMEMLIAGTSLDDITTRDILNIDSKEFNLNGIKVQISQLNTVDMNGIMNRKDEIEKTISDEITSKGYDLFLLIITDIVNTGSQIIGLGDKISLVEDAFKIKMEKNSAWLEGVVSRKKQIVPFLMVAAQNIED